MQVFKAFLKVLLKNINVACIYIGVFLGIAIPMSKVGAKETSFKAERMDVCIFDEDATPESQALVEYIASMNDIKELPAGDRDAVIDGLYYETVDFVLTIKSGYGEGLRSGSAETFLESSHMHDSYSTVYMSQQLSEYVSSVRGYLGTEPDTASALAKARENLSQKVEVSFPEKTADREDYPTSFAAYFQYMPYILICIYMSVLLTILRTLNDPDIRKRTNCSCISTGSYTAQLFLGCGVFVLAAWLLMVAVGAMLHGMYTGRALLAVFNSFSFMLLAALMAIFVSSFSPDVMLQNLLTQILSLGMSFLCGIFIPQSMLSESVLNAGKCLPAYWYVKANNMLCGTDVYTRKDFGICIAVQLCFAAVFAIGSVIVTKVRRDKAI